jgi:hypothetical protein
MSDFIPFIALGIIVLMAAVIVGLGLLFRNPEGAKRIALRPVDAFNDLPQRAGESVEKGTRIHVSLGSGNVGTQSTTGVLAGLTVLDAIADAATISDKPPVVTSGDGASATLAQNSLRRAYNRQNAIERYDHLSGRFTGPTPISYTAGVMMTLKEEQVSTSLLVGTFGNEVALMADAGQGEKAHQIIATDDVQGQAAAYVMADEALIGEDMYASGAYLLGGKPFHKASLIAQDVVRILVVIALLAGGAYYLVFGK